MSARVKKYLPVLKRIRKLGERAKREYVRKCDKEFVDCVSECAKNVIKGNVPLTDRQKTTLRRKRNDIRALSLKKLLFEINAKFCRKVDISPLFWRRFCRFSVVVFEVMQTARSWFLSTNSIGSTSDFGDLPTP